MKTGRNLFGNHRAFKGQKIPCAISGNELFRQEFSGTIVRRSSLQYLLHYRIRESNET